MLCRLFGLRAKKIKRFEDDSILPLGMFSHLNLSVTSILHHSFSLFLLIYLRHILVFSPSADFFLYLVNKTFFVCSFLIRGAPLAPPVPGPLHAYIPTDSHAANTVCKQSSKIMQNFSYVQNVTSCFRYLQLF